MLVVGIGIGLVMQVLVLVVQNDVRPQDIGVATSTATFFRSVGGAFGVAIFGTIFATRLAHQLARLPHGVIARLGSGVHLNPAQARHLPPAVHARLPARVRPRPPRRLPLGHGDRRHPLRALVAPQRGAAPDDAAPLGRAQRRTGCRRRSNGRSARRTLRAREPSRVSHSSPEKRSHAACLETDRASPICAQLRPLARQWRTIAPTFDSSSSIVRYCRANGRSWAQIGEALSVSKQAAWERFSGEE